jgi:ATP-dependent protease ClpP protease subunit
MIFRSEKNTLSCFGQIWEGNGIEFMYQLNRLAASYDEIIIKLHTYGGSVFDGNLMFNAINSSKTKIIIEVQGVAASMGAFLLMATPHVHIVENGYIMIHAPQSGSRGTSEELKKAAKLLDKMEENFVSKIMQRTGLPKAKAQAYMQGDNWIDAKEAIQLGIATKELSAVVVPKIGLEEPASLGQLEVYNAYASMITTTENKPKLNTNMKKELIALFALAMVTEESSDTAVIEAVKEKVNALKKDKKDAEAALVVAQTSLSAFQDNQISQIVEAYAKQNKIDDEKKKIFENIGKTSGIEALQAVLETGTQKPQAPNFTGMMNAGKQGDATRATWDWDKWQKEDPRGLETMASDNAEEWNELFNKKYN